VTRAPQAHRRDHGSAEQHRSDQVHGDQFAYAIGLEIDERSGEVDTGVVGEHVDRAVRLDRADQRLDGRGVGKIGPVGLATKLGGKICDRVTSPGDEGDPRPPAGELCRELRADPA
jgi:hypothetical protein